MTTVHEIDDQGGTAAVAGLGSGTRIVKDVTSASVQVGDRIGSN